MIILKNKNIATTKIDDELMLLCIDSGTYYKLDKVGAYIWENINDGSTLKDINLKIDKEFAGTNDNTVNEVSQFIDMMQKYGLLNVKS